MNIAVVGYATEGSVSAEYFARLGHDVTICDKNNDVVVPHQYQHQLGERYLDNLDRFDVIVRSAGVHPQVILAHNPGVGPKITTAVNEFLQQSPSRNIIGVTGTKGKGTTSTLVSKILEAHGHKTWLGGNIGRSPLEFIGDVEPEDWVVLELSSFQLYDVQASPHIAVCLMVVPEHLDWHKDVDDYYAAKAQLFRYQSRDDVAVYFADNQTSVRIASSGEASKVPYFADPGAKVCDHNHIEIEGSTKICPVDELQLLGAHNWQNVCAAITAAWQAGCKDIANIRQAVTSFTGLPHRLEFVRSVNDVDYYDDSFGTTPETAIVAIKAFEQPKVVILGGSDKGASFEQLADVVGKENVRHVVLIGDTAPAIETALKSKGFTNISTGAKTMQHVVDESRSHAQAGDIVLLSTGCASFGMFKNYKDRGEQFIATVKALS
jgi:UDP-N-acetylmuramoylalanine--D-glutamate ligase